MRPLSLAALLALTSCSTASPPSPRYVVSHGFAADTGGFCRLSFQITTNATAGASFSILLDSINGNAPALSVQFRQDTNVTFVPQRPPPYWAFWQVYFAVPGTAVVGGGLDSSRIVAAPTC